MKTQTKLIVVLSIICSAIVVLFSSATYYFVNEYSYSDFYKRLETRERIFTRYQLYQDSASTNGLIVLKNQYLLSTIHLHHYNNQVRWNIYNPPVFFHF